MGLKTILIWTKDDIKFLQEHYAIMKKDNIAKALGRSKGAVVEKAYALRHGKRLEGKEVPSPSEEQLKMLYLENNKTPFEIAQKFKVSPSTVYRWLHQSNIPFKRPFLSNVKINLASIECAYLAGYLDGDGTITIGLSKNKKNKRGLNTHFDVSLITCKRDFAIELRKIIGGNLQSFIYYDSREKKHGYKIAFGNQRSALAFLQVIEPFLILKREQAKLMIEYLKQRIKDREHGNATPIGDRCWEIINEIRRLNHGSKGRRTKNTP